MQEVIGLFHSSAIWCARVTDIKSSTRSVQAALNTFGNVFWKKTEIYPLVDLLVGKRHQGNETRLQEYSKIERVFRKNHNLLL